MDSDKPIDANLLKRMMLGDFSAFSAEAQSSAKEKPRTTTPKRNVELDLHFEKLHPDKLKLSAAEKLNLQLEELKSFAKEARKKGVTSAYVIVGKGEGVLLGQAKKVLNEQGIKHSQVLDPPYFGNALKIKL